MPNDADRDDVARGERQHAERGRGAGAEQRRRQVRDGGLERLLAVAVPPLLVLVLHDVHVVGDREDDDERHDHAGEHVVGEAEQRVEPERPEHADRRANSVSTVLRHERNVSVDREDREQQDRRRELALVVEGDAVVGLADLEAAVVVRPDPGGSRGSTMSWIRWMTPARTASMRSSSKLTTSAVTVASSETRSPRISSSSSARRRGTASGPLVAGDVDQPPHVEAVGHGVDDRWRSRGCRRAGRCRRARCRR